MEHLNYDRQFYEDNILIHERAVHRFVRSIVKDPEDASDVSQITMLKAWEKMDDIRTPQKAKSWLFQIAYRESMIHLRRHTGENRLLSLQGTEDRRAAYQDGDESESVLDFMIREYEGSVAMKAFLMLDKESRNLIRLRYLEAFSPKEMAEIMDTNRGTVRSSLCRALKKYRDIYSRVESGCGRDIRGSAGK